MTTTFTAAPLQNLLARLFDQADASTSPALAGISRDERERLMRSKTEYLDFYSRLKDLWLPVSRETGTLLYMLARSTQARHIVEFGTSFGISTLHLAEGGLADLVEIREGDALTTLAVDLPESIDLLLLDGAKSLYADILALLEPRLRPGALIVADNADYCPEYLAYVRSPGSGYLSVPFAGDVELSMRLG